MILVDSNLWIYLLDATTKEHTQARTAVPRLLDDGLLMPTLVQIEVVHYLARRLGPDAKDAIDDFLAQESEVEPLGAGIATEAASVLLAHQGSGIGGRDACLLVLAKRRDATLATADKALNQVGRAMGLRVTNPLAGKA